MSEAVRKTHRAAILEIVRPVDLSAIGNAHGHPEPRTGLAGDRRRARGDVAGPRSQEHVRDAFSGLPNAEGGRIEPPRKRFVANRLTRLAWLTTMSSPRGHRVSDDGVRHRLQEGVSRHEATSAPRRSPRDRPASASGQRAGEARCQHLGRQLARPRRRDRRPRNSRPRPAPTSSSSPAAPSTA